MKPITALSISLLVSITLAACTVKGSPGSNQKETEALLASITAPVDKTQAPALVKSTTPLPATIQPSDTIEPASPTQEPSLLPPTDLPVTPTPACNQASPGNPVDITIPDDTAMQPGQSFTKTWRLKNGGSCVWTKQYAMVWWSGEKFSAPIMTNLPNAVAPGSSIDLSLDMVAPDNPGTYQSNWKLQDPAGVLFGIGPSGGSPFWVRIVVNQAEAQQPSATRQVTPTAIVYISGLANLRLGDRLDLDTNQLNRGDGDDLLFNRQGDTDFQLVPLGEARMQIFGGSQPAMSDCQAAGLTSDPVHLSDLAAGSYLCYRTNQGLPGYSRLVFLNAPDSTVSLEIITWSIP